MQTHSKKSSPVPARLLRHPVHVISLGFGSGLSPVAPGTVGTLAAIPVFLLLNQLDFMLYTVMVVASFAIGVYCTGLTGKAIGVTDHGAIVWDEFVGYFITMAVLPLDLLAVNYSYTALSVWIVSGFALFRLFDIWKPWPISWCERRFSGGYGVMLDDVVAGIFAAICLQLLMFVVK